MRHRIGSTLATIICRLIPEQIAIILIKIYFSNLPGSTPPKKALYMICTSQDILHSSLSDAATRYESTGLHPKHRIMQYHDFFVKRIHPEENVLDIGCGAGAVAYSIAEGGGNVIAIDISERNINEANRMFPHQNIQYICGDALDYVPSKAIDVVVMSNVLEHIEDRIGFLHQLVDTLPKARYLIRVPRKDRHWSVYFREELGLNWLLDATHYTEYTYESLAEELKVAGLMITHVEFQWEEIWAEAVRRR
jgi:2-polyprenyl-3-methyl-5-hydroxy-6-metoxy-1,4-benzoquinol methylase